MSTLKRQLQNSFALQNRPFEAISPHSPCPAHTARSRNQGRFTCLLFKGPLDL
ncbi:MAG: hypothetical protein AB7H48_01865 [Parachlamydiales bacterium]